MKPLYLCEGIVEIGQMNHVSRTSDQLSFSNAAGGCPEALLKLHRFAQSSNQCAIF